MAKLVIERKWELNNLLNRFDIYLDGNKIGNIRGGKVFEYDLEYGKHQLYTKINTCQSVQMEIEIKENQTKRIKLTGLRYGDLQVLLITMVYISFLVLNIVFNINLTALLIIGVILSLYPVYWLTFRRKKYLRIKEVN